MRFGAPDYLWLLLAVPVLAGMLALALWGRRRALGRFGDEPLVQRLSGSVSLELVRLRSSKVLLTRLLTRKFRLSCRNL